MPKVLTALHKASRMEEIWIEFEAEVRRDMPQDASKAALDPQLGKSGCLCFHNALPFCAINMAVAVKCDYTWVANACPDFGPLIRSSNL